MQKINKIIILFIIIFSTLNFKISNADFFEKTFEFDKNPEEFQLNLNKIKNYNLKNKKYKKQNLIMIKINPIIKKALIKKYKKNGLSYYQMQGIVKHYNNFIYYSDKYFESLKDQEIYGDTKEVQRSILKNYTNMKFYYIKFKNSLTK